MRRLMAVAVIALLAGTAWADDSGAGPGDWFWSAWTDRMDDSRTTRVYRFAEDEARHRFGAVRPTLYLACEDDITFIAVGMDHFVAFDRVEVTWRLDRDPPLTEHLPVTQSGETFVLAHGSQAINIIRDFLTRSRLLFRVRPAASRAMDFEFDLRDARAAVARVAKACRWRGGVSGKG